MKVKNRFLICLIMMVAYLSAILFIGLLCQVLGLNLIILIVSVPVINLIYSHYMLKWAPLFILLCPLFILCLSIYSSHELAILFGKNDGILPSYIEIILNVIITVLLWEVVYQIKIRKE